MLQTGIQSLPPVSLLVNINEPTCTHTEILSFGFTKMESFSNTSCNQLSSHLHHALPSSSVDELILLLIAVQGVRPSINICSGCPAFLNASNKALLCADLQTTPPGRRSRRMWSVFTCGLNSNRIKKSLCEFLVLGCLHQKGPQLAWSELLVYR